jgi:hypothetical protein
MSTGTGAYHVDWVAIFKIAVQRQWTLSSQPTAIECRATAAATTTVTAAATAVASEVASEVRPPAAFTLTVCTAASNIRLLELLGVAIVTDLHHFRFSDENVGGLDVQVEHAVGVCVAEA